MEYQEQLNWLFNQFPSYQDKGGVAYKPTLENTLKLLEILGSPEQQLKFVHVAGSNGKGSTCSYIASALTEAGYKTGLFTSPHLVDFRERIRIDGKMIPEEDVHEFISWIRTCELGFSPSFFEVSFCLALKHFYDSECEICVIETGLGGRLDATNVIQPLISAITSISLEHTEILGDNIEKIAFEKGGIIKFNTPTVIGKLDPKALEIISEICKERNSQLSRTKENVDLNTQIPSLPTYQYDNLSIAFEVIHLLNQRGFKITEKSFLAGFSNLRQNTGLFGRFQIVHQKPLIIFDVAHNPDGIAKLIEFVQSIGARQLHIVYGTSADKDINSILREIPDDALCYVSRFSNPRSMTESELFNHFVRSGKTVKSFFTPNKALEAAQLVSNDEDIILCCGSFFLISDLL